MDFLEAIEIFIKMFEKIFLKHQNKKTIEDYRLNKYNLLKDLELKTEKIIEDIDKDIKDYEQRFKDYKAAGVNTDNIIKTIDELNTNKDRQKKKLQDIKKLKD